MSGMNLAILSVLAEITPVSTAINESLFNVWTGLLTFLWYVLVAIAMWMVFAKAGWPGILALIPIVNIVFSIIVAIKVGAAFGKGGVWSFFLLWLIAFIGYFILGFGDAKYTKPVKA